MQDDAKRLEPCPFCGGVALLENTITQASIMCCNCPAVMRRDHTTRIFDDGTYTVTEAWNRRTPAPAQPADVERVARALVPVLCGSQEDQWGCPLPDKQFDDLSPDWQERHRDYARAALAAMPATPPADADAGLVAKIIHDTLENDDDSDGGGYMRAANAVLAALGQGGVR